MTYGLRIINDDSELLVDSEYFSPSFVQKLEFNTTPIGTEAPTGQLHPGYVKRTYNTPAITAAGNYIVMWTIPDNGNDVWYSFETSTTNINGTLTCYIYANSTGSALSYTLPTAYLFTTDTLPSSSGYGLRLYNAAGTKTFDSNNLQLAPYSISDAFAFSIAGANPDVYGATPVSISLSMPASPIFMIPDYAALRIKQGSGFARHDEYVYQSAFKRSGTSLSTRLFISYYALEDYFWPSATTTYTTGKNADLSVLVANANLYEAAAGQGGSGTTVTYSLESSATSRNEGTSVTITLNTTNVSDGTKIYYTVTGISTEDLTAGGTTGYFNISSNTATAVFTFKNDYLTENNEVFLLSLDGLSQSISVTVNDTSLTPSYSWSTPNNVNEGSTGYTTFNATNANGKTVTFEPWAPLAGNSISGASDGTIITTSWTVSGNAATSINVQYSAQADATTEGPETFRIRAVVDGVAYFSDDITINDTSKTVGYSVSATDNWNESNSYSVTISANNVNGTTLYLTTDNSLVTPASSTVTVDSDTFSTNVSYTAGIVTANTTVRLHIRTGSASGTIEAYKDITLVNVTPTYSFATPVAFDEGATGGSIQFSYSYAANTDFTFEVIGPSGDVADGSGDITLTTTTHSVGASNDSGAVTVSYSAEADTTTEGSQYFRINAKIGTTIVKTSNNITINDSSVYLTAGTAIGSAYCVAGTYTLRQVRANGSGGTYNDDTNNSATCGYVAATYSLAASPTSANETTARTVTFTLTTNQTGSFAYTITGINSSDLSSGSLTGTISNGAAGAVSITLSTDQQTEDTETLTFALNNGLASTSVTISDTSQKVTSISRSGGASGTVGTSFSQGTFTASVNGSQYPAQWSSSGTIPPGLTLTQQSLSFGSYYQTYTLTGTPTTAGTYNYTISATTSSGDSISQNFSTSISNPSPSYSLSSYPTGTVSNGGSTTFYHNSSYANGTAVTISVSASASSYVTVSPASFTVSGNSEAKPITLTWSARSAGATALSVTISTSTGKSFSFTLPAVTAVIPLVSSITYLPDQTTYRNGETVNAVINMSGNIISGTYVRVAIFINGSESAPGGWNVFAAGTPYSGPAPAYITASFPIGTSAGNQSVTNPGLNATVSIRARTVLSDGTPDPRQTAYIAGPTRNLSSAAPT